MKKLIICWILLILTILVALYINAQWTEESGSTQSMSRDISQSVTFTGSSVTFDTDNLVLPTSGIEGAGAGSELDADTLDGQEGAYYLGAASGATITENYNAIRATAATVTDNYNTMMTSFNTLDSNNATQDTSITNIQVSTFMSTAVRDNWIPSSDGDKTLGDATNHWDAQYLVNLATAGGVTTVYKEIGFTIPSDAFVSDGIVYSASLSYNFTLSSITVNVGADGTAPVGCSIDFMVAYSTGGSSNDGFEDVLAASSTLKIAPGEKFGYADSFNMTDFYTSAIFRIDITQKGSTTAGGDPILVTLSGIQE